MVNPDDLKIVNEGSYLRVILSLIKHLHLFLPDETNLNVFKKYAINIFCKQKALIRTFHSRFLTIQ